MTTTLRRQFASIEDIQRANVQAGQYFFSPSTMRFFDSRVLPTLYGPEGRVFVTSEKDPFGNPRAYTVRYIDSRGHIQDAGGFQAHASAARAKTAARQVAERLAAYAAVGQAEDEVALLLEHDADETLHAFATVVGGGDTCTACGDTAEGLMHNNTWRSVEPLLQD